MAIPYQLAKSKRNIVGTKKGEAKTMANKEEAMRLVAEHNKKIMALKSRRNKAIK